MTRHLFLTGAKQVGKSTLLRTLLADFGGSVGGFFTVRTNTFQQDDYTVHLLPAGQKSAASAENLLFVCGHPDGATAARFDTLGCTALAESVGCDLLVLDELGPHEATAARFRRAVCALLDGDTPLLGVLQAPAEDFWPELTRHPAVTVLALTPENRPAVEAAARAWLKDSLQAR